MGQQDPSLLSLIGAFREPIGQLLGKETPEFAFALTEWMGWDVPLPGPARYGLLVQAEELPGLSWIEEFAMRHYVSFRHEREYRGEGTDSEY
jgi:hypothetical protein